MKMKEKNELYEKEKEKRQSSLDILLKVKEKEIANSLQVVEQKKKKKNNLEKILEKNVDMTQINELYNKIKNAENEMKKLEKEKESLEKIKEEHHNCQIKEQNIIKEIENIREELRYIQLEIRNRRENEEDRKFIHYNAIKNEDQKKNLISKSSELPPINNNQIKLIKQHEEDKIVNVNEIDEYLGLD